MASSNASTSEPVKPRQLRTQVVETGDGLEVTYRPREWTGGCFLLLWLCGWTVGCVFLLVAVVQKPEFRMFLFGIPFWASWVFVAGIVVRGFFLFERLELNNDVAHHSSSVLSWSTVREIPVEEIREFVLSSTNSDENHTYYVELMTTGQPLPMFSGLPHDERIWLVWRLNQELDRLGIGGSGTKQASPGISEDDAFAPSDSSWQRDESALGLQFVQRGSFQGSAIGGLLFINLFWNGIVSVFVTVLFGGDAAGPAMGSLEWWGMFLFLIPFEVIGLLMFFGLLGVVLEPVRRTYWTVSAEEITSRYTLLGVGRTWQYPAFEITRVELRIAPQGTTQQFKLESANPAKQLTTATQVYQLRFVNRDNSELISVNNLTEGECRWMGYMIARELRNWEVVDHISQSVD